ncbi:MAG: hypothetical protein IJ306_01700 [Oscillospiraceae bacterium]|nr:hypothetical protein [Oscillospiraceae bacterium]
MKCYESEHYIFHYGAGTKAEKDIAEIAAYQENCFQYICRILDVTPEFKIEYFLCDSPEEVGRIYGNDYPCNGFAAPPDKIYAVYNEQVQCIGFHEDAHIISFTVNRPHCPAITEGLAMYFDRKWWGIQNMDWVGYYIKTGRYIRVDQLLDREFFFQQDDTITYPIMGAFTEWLITTYGAKTYMRMYKQQDMVSAMIQVYKQTPKEMNQAFTNYIGLFKNDKVLEQRMEDLLSE